MSGLRGCGEPAFGHFGLPLAVRRRLADIHGDPFDRILIATALEKGMGFVTSDSKIRQSPNLKTLWYNWMGEEENGARYRFRTCDPYRVKVVLYH